MDASTTQEQNSLPAVAVEGTYRDGAIVLAAPLDLPAGTPLTVELRGSRAVATPLAASGAAGLRWRLPAVGWPAGALARTRADALLLTLVLLLYLATRLVGLERFPIYFFSDEAIQVTLAEELLQRGLSDSSGSFLPAYFYNADKWSLGLTVYIQALGIAAFGKSLLAARATSVLVSALAVAAVCLTLRLVFRSPSWWLGGLALTAAPAWFLHSRTAFETVSMVAFYACFLCCYLLYRRRAAGYLVPALLFGAATFYSYTNGQGVMLVSGVLLLLSDARHHLRTPWRVKLAALATAALVAAPYVRFRLLHPEAVISHLRTLDSYWFHDITLAEKLARFGERYLRGISPLYWFVPNEFDLVRHRMGPFGHLPLLLLPFVLLGVFVCLRSWRSSEHRAVLIALAAAPFTSSLADIFVTRSLAMVVPFALLTAIGFDQVAAWLAPRIAPRAVALVGAVGALALCLWLPVVALRDGPTWYSDYGMYGMQYGAPQVMGAARELLRADPALDLRLSPNWANNTNVFLQFFLTPDERRHIQMDAIDGYLEDRRDIPPAALFMLIPEEYDKARGDPKLVVSEPVRTLPYPDGRPGFFFVHLAYAPQAEAIFAAERLERQRPQDDTIEIDGQRVALRISRLDMGRPVDLFDGDTWTLVRSLEANPLVLDLTFPEPRALSGLRLSTTTMDIALTVTLTEPGATEPRVFSETYLNLPSEPTVELELPGGPYTAGALRIEITKLTGGDAHVHVREITLR